MIEEIYQREVSESKKQIAIIEIFTVIYFGHIDNKMKSFRIDLNFVIDPITIDGDELCMDQDAEGLAELRQKSIWGKVAEGKERKQYTG